MLPCLSANQELAELAAYVGLPLVGHWVLLRRGLLADWGALADPFVAMSLLTA
jgi:hypothetical protein